jgi:hypothetical protein
LNGLARRGVEAGIRSKLISGHPAKLLVRDATKKLKFFERDNNSLKALKEISDLGIRFSLADAVLAR